MSLRDWIVLVSPFAMSQCSYLGHIVGNGEVRPEQSKLQAINEFPTPTTKYVSSWVLWGIIGGSLPTTLRLQCP